MSTAMSVLSTPVCTAISWALVHSLWQGALIALALAGAMALLPRHLARVRYAAAAMTLLILALLPAATALSLLSREAPETLPVVLAGRAESPALHDHRSATAVAAGTGSRTGWERVSRAIDPMLPAVVLVWLLGVALLSIRNLGGWLRVRSLSSRLTRPVSAEIEAVFERLARALALSRPVRLVESGLARVPTVIGWLSPVVLMPASALTGLDLRQLEAILAHELAHVRRLDYLVNLLQAAVETLLFYHPAVWWVSRQMRLEREHCCDDVAAALCGDPIVLARALARVEEIRAHTPALALAASGGALLSRIRRLVVPASRRPPSVWVAGLFAASLVLGIAVAFAGPKLDQQTSRVAGPEQVESGPRSAATTHAAETSALDVDPDPKGRLGADDPDLEGEASRHDVALPVRSGGAGSSPVGTWQAHAADDGILVEMRTRKDGGIHLSALTLAAESPALLDRDRLAFEVRREAGRLVFEGARTGAGAGWQASGDLFFAPREAYRDEMRQLGYAAVDAEQALLLAVHGVDRTFVQELRAEGYERLSLGRLASLAANGVDARYVRDMRRLGYASLDASRLVGLGIYGVTPRYIEDLVAAGLVGLGLDELVKLRIYDISPDDVRGFREAGLGRLSPRALVELAIQGITPVFARRMTDALGEQPNTQELIKLKLFRVTPEYVVALRRAGLLDAGVDRIVAMKNRGVRPEDS